MVSVHAQYVRFHNFPLTFNNLCHFHVFVNGDEMSCLSRIFFITFDNPNHCNTTHYRSCLQTVDYSGHCSLDSPVKTKAIFQFKNTVWEVQAITKKNQSIINELQYKLLRLRNKYFGGVRQFTWWKTSLKWLQS